MPERPFDRNRIEAEPPDHLGQQPALDRIIIDDQDASRHSVIPYFGDSQALSPFDALCGSCVNRL